VKVDKRALSNLDRWQELLPDASVKGGIAYRADFLELPLGDESARLRRTGDYRL
jgi:hypothetical protein